jgi:hypothetical protein
LSAASQTALSATFRTALSAASFPNKQHCQQLPRRTRASAPATSFN